MTEHLPNIQMTLGLISSITHCLPKQTKKPKKPQTILYWELEMRRRWWRTCRASTKAWVWFSHLTGWRSGALALTAQQVGG